MAKKRPIAGPRLIEAKNTTLAELASGVSPPTRMIFVEDSPGIDIAFRGEGRSKWIDDKCEDKQWDSDTDISSNNGPSYNAIARYRSGVISSRDPYVRRKLAKAFDCKIKDVPK